MLIARAPVHLVLSISSPSSSQAWAYPSSTRIHTHQQSSTACSRVPPGPGARPRREAQRTSSPRARPDVLRPPRVQTCPLLSARCAGEQRVCSQSARAWNLGKSKLPGRRCGPGSLLCATRSQPGGQSAPIEHCASHPLDEWGEGAWKGVMF